MKKIKVFMTLAVILPLVTFAQIQTKKVSFGAGKSSAVLNGSIKGDLIVDYELTVKQNQTISVSLQTKSNSLYFNLMEPGSTGEAIYIGESDGTNKYSGTTAKAGTYKIRVYLNRAAARKGSAANYGLKVAVSGAGAKNVADAKVPGTKYNATGSLDAALGGAAKGSSTAKFGVVRSSGGAYFDVQISGLLKHKLHFSQGEWTCDGGNTVTTKKKGDEWEVIINDYEHYFIVDGMIYGG